MPIRFVFGLHDHQPVGNFDGVFEQAYRDGYLPFVELIEDYPEIPVVLHTSGCLLEWLIEHKPEYVQRLRRLVERGQVEILGGAFYEPILTMLPRRDRVGQIQSYTTYLHQLFPGEIRGMWLAERVWEPELVTDLHRAGIEFTLLDDYHFKQAGLEEHQLYGYYLSEDQGRLIKVFPISERSRYLVPWKDPEECIAWLGDVNSKNPNAVIVCADDGEKFGVWPETHKHCYTNGWLRRFFDLLRKNQHWIKCCTLSQAVDATPAAGMIYLPDCSYREMTEWALPATRLSAYQGMVRQVEKQPFGDDVKRSLRGGFWRNFKAKYPEVHEMYCRMLQVSRTVEEAEKRGSREAETQRRGDAEKRGGDVSPLPRVSASPLPTFNASSASQELYRGQCNCGYWHGAFGGLYLPHLRNAIYHHLIAAENEASESDTRTARLVHVEVRDFNLDTFPEINLSNSALAAYFAPARGGSMYELDLRAIAHNLLATLSRRPEVYHQTILQAAGIGRDEGWKALHEQVKFKQQGLEKLLQYDWYLRKSLIDHFYEPSVTLTEVAALREKELGDFVLGGYLHELRREPRTITLTLERSGQVAGVPVKVTKDVALKADSDTLFIRYRLENLPKDRALHFAVEFNFAGMAAGADDRYFYSAAKPRAGQLQTLQDLPNAAMIGLVDEWLGLDVSLRLSQPGGIWAFPIQTVSQSEGGFELVHQSTAVLPHWQVRGDAQGKWEAAMELKLDTSRAEKR